jgi:hypothetical protein
MARSGSPQVTLGIALLVVGGILLATRFVAVETAPAWFLGIGCGLALLGIVRRAYAPLLLGLILTGLGSGMLLGDAGVAGVQAGTWLLFGLGAGLALVYPIALLVRVRTHWWPFALGLFLAAIGGVRVVEHFRFLPPDIEIAARTWWPAVLVLAGAWFLIKGLRR